MARQSSRIGNRSNQWSLIAFAVVGAVIGVMIGFAWGWLDYGRVEVSFMYGHVIGLAVICATMGLAIAAVRNWAKRNPMA